MLWIKRLLLAIIKDKDGNVTEINKEIKVDKEGKKKEIIKDENGNVIKELTIEKEYSSKGNNDINEDKNNAK